MIEVFFNNHVQSRYHHSGLEKRALMCHNVSADITNLATKVSTDRFSILNYGFAVWIEGQ